MKECVKFAVLADAHYGKDHFAGKACTLGTKSPALLRQFVNEMNKRFKPDFVISLGDAIVNESRKQDKELMWQYRKYLSNLKMPAYFVIGNHDVRHIKDKEAKKILGIKRFYGTFKTGHLQFITLYSFAKIENLQRLIQPVLILNKQLRWLKSTLKKSKKQIVVFNHYPLDEQDLKTNPYADFWRRYPWRAIVQNRSLVRKTFESSKKVLAVFTGHLHWSRKHIIRNIPYYSIPSLTEVRHSAWSEVTICGKKISVRTRKVRI